jgi:hypothetical protein
VTSEIKLFLSASTFVWFFTSSLLALIYDRGRISKNDAEVKALIDKCCLYVLKYYIDFIYFSAFC